MTFRVLQSYKENTNARAELIRRGASYWPRRPERRGLAEHLRSAIQVGELNKSWDVLETLHFLESRSLQSQPVIDLGAFASETVCALHLAGFANLTAIDLNPRIRKMPFADAVEYLVGDMSDTHLPAGTFAAAVAISSIEHGYHPGPLLSEVSRLLRPGGVFVGTTDYWREKVDTSGIQMFGMDWRIFSEQEVRQFFAEAACHGLHPVGECDFSCDEASIECADRFYTFGWFALERR